MRLLTCILLLLVGFAGCLSNDGDSTTNPPPGESEARMSFNEWNATLSEPIYEGITSQIYYIDADDGTKLSLTVHLPAGIDRTDVLPTLLQITPYQAGRTAQPDGSTTGPSNSWGDFVRRGAAYVEADARGTNGSEGCLDFGGTADRSDAATFVAWIRSQSWSDGRVVTDGVSHPGMGSIVANAAVPDLTAALAHAPVVSYYQDQWLLGARMEQINEIYQAYDSLPAGYLDAQSLQSQAAPCTGQTALDFGQVDGPFTDLWDDRDLSRHTDATNSPILMTQGFVDLNVHPDHVQLYWDSLPEDYPKHMILGWWYHGWPDMDGHAAEEFSRIRHRWLDTTLFESDNGLWNEPRVLVEDSKGTWHEGNDWPLELSETMQLHPDADGGLNQMAPATDSVSYADPVAGSEMAARGSWDGGSVVFRTAPLETAAMVNGAPTVHLVASSSATETKWVTYLVDEAPDGSWEWISHGYADSHLWGEEDVWADMVPGTQYDWDIPLFPTAVVVEAGHSIALVVASQDSGLAEPGDHCFSDYRGGCYSPTGILPSQSAGQATNTIHLGAEGTWVELSLVDPSITQKAELPPPSE